MIFLTSQSKKAILGMLLAVVLWSTTYSFVQISLKYVPPFSLAFLRGALSVILLLIPVIYHKKLAGLIKLLKEKPIMAILLGITGFAAIHIFQNLGISKTTTSLTALLANTGPIFIFLLAVIFLKEKPTLPKVTGLIFGLIGVSIIVLNGQNLSEIIKTESFLGNFLILLLSISWSIYTILTKKISKKYSSNDITLASFIAGTPILLPFMFLYEKQVFQIPASVSQISWIPILIILYLGFVLMATTSLWNYSLSKIDLSITAMFLYLIPIFGIFIGVIFLHETFSVIDMIGAVFVFAGMYLTQLHPKKSQ